MKTKKDTHAEKSINKRNEFQKAEDRSLAIELLKQGWTFAKIAEHLSEIRPYTISHQQVASDMRSIRLQSIASTTEHMSVIIDMELQEIEKTLTQIDEALAVKRELLETTETGCSEKTGAYEKAKTQWVNVTKPTALLTTRLAAIARRSALLGLEAYLKYQDRNVAISVLTNDGYQVSNPNEVEC